MAVQIKIYIRNKNADCKRITFKPPSRLSELRVIRGAGLLRLPSEELINSELHKEEIDYKLRS